MEKITDEWRIFILRRRPAKTHARNAKMKRLLSMVRFGAIGELHYFYRVPGGNATPNCEKKSPFCEIEYFIATTAGCNRTASDRSSKLVCTRLDRTEFGLTWFDRFDSGLSVAGSDDSGGLGDRPKISRIRRSRSSGLT